MTQVDSHPTRTKVLAWLIVIAFLVLVLFYGGGYLPDGPNLP